MHPSAREVPLEAIKTWRALFRGEMNCAIKHDKLHARDGWTREFLLSLGETEVGYGSIVDQGPWKGTPTIFEFYVAPLFRARLFDLFGTLVAKSGATCVVAQTTDVTLSVMLFAHCREIASEKILFQDGLTTAFQLPSARFRRITPADAERIFEHRREPVGEWCVDISGVIVATGSVPGSTYSPDGEIFMEVAGPFRQRGIGTWLVQELKRVCVERGGNPCARCNPDNLASLKTLQKAGFVPNGNILNGKLRIK
jgi:GNAT superfamily N-acetyltransferase